MTRPMFCLVKTKGAVRCTIFRIVAQRESIPKSEVQIHEHLPSSYLPMADLFARSGGFADADENRAQAITLMRRKAAKIGANGLLLNHRIEMNLYKTGKPRILSDRMIDDFPEGDMLVVAQAIYVPESRDD